MTTEKQIEANRENAKLGGVKTNEGKAISRYNAIKHGLLSEEVLIKGENEKILIELGKKLRAELKPETEMELLLIDRIIANFWRLKRLLKIEYGEVLTSGVMDDNLILTNDTDLFCRYEIMLERSIYKALHELQRLQAYRNGEKSSLPLAVDVDINSDREAYK